jgi:ATP-dependent 26S proteasome regulatory subunit
MPQQFEIGLPGPQQREQILKLILKETAVEENFALEELAKLLEGYSGSDMKVIMLSQALCCLK